MRSNFQIMHTISSWFVTFCINWGVLLHIVYITVQLQQIHHYVCTITSIHTIHCTLDLANDMDIHAMRTSFNITQQCVNKKLHVHTMSPFLDESVELYINRSCWMSLQDKNQLLSDISSQNFWSLLLLLAHWCKVLPRLVHSSKIDRQSDTSSISPSGRTSRII